MLPPTIPPFNSFNTNTPDTRTGRAVAALAAGALAISTVAACSTGNDVAAGTSASASGSQTTVNKQMTFDKQTVTPLNPQANSRPQAVANLPRGFDLQAHRGGRGQWTEESAQAMKNSLALGVTTLELDIVLSKDGVPVVWHDPDVKPEKCADTAPAREGDPQFPYVGKLVHDLTFEQLSTLDCAKKLEDFPDAEVIAGNKMMTLPQLFDLTRDNKDIHFNIETKIEGEKRGDSAEPQQFVDTILDEVDRAGVADRVMIQSFDWRSLPLVAKRNPDIPLVLLWDETTWKKGSPWTGDVSYDAVGGDIIAAAQQVGVQVLSPGHSVPYGKKPSDPDYNPIATPELISRAHAAGMVVVPWTVNEKETMREQIAAGVDGLITDYPTRLREVLAELGMDLPSPAPVK
nr:glycerophosphodiester phosphodiesterase family protein [Corynebacterium lactis]